MFFTSETGAWMDWQGIHLDLEVMWGDPEGDDCDSDTAEVIIEFETWTDSDYRGGFREVELGRIYVEAFGTEFELDEDAIFHGYKEDEEYDGVLRVSRDQFDEDMVGLIHDAIDEARAEAHIP